ncbi:MAG TPA: DUF4429 domain-containing protein [Nonomuraea sp.]|nr:DUF4429 domain-containing protein [Nonomuraea sp.]
MNAKGVLGTISFDGEWVTIAKTPPGSRSAPMRFRAVDVTGTRFKPGTLLFNGYVQFHVPGSLATGQQANGRPHPGDPYSLHIRKSANEAVEQLVTAVEQARS